MDLTARMARQAKARSGEVGRVQRIAGDQRPAGWVIAGCVDQVGVLHQRASGDRPDVRGNRTRSGGHQHCRVAFFVRMSRASCSKDGGDDHLGEHAFQLCGHRRRDGTVGGDHAAVGRHRIARVGLRVRHRDIRTDRDATRVGVLDDRHAGLVEVVGRPIGRVAVEVVVEAHRLAVQLLGLCDPRLGPCCTYSAALVRVLAVTKHRGTFQRRPRRATSMASRRVPSVPANS